jgi:hypothetical protein
MNDLAYFKELAFKNGGNAQDQIACYVELLEAHIGSQNAVIDTFVEELNLLLLELTQEKS